jgi:uncharacterized coiled-coil protein SlyX
MATVPLNIRHPFVDLVRAQFERAPQLRGELAKANCFLKEYADHIAIPLQNLSVFYVCAPTGGLHPDLTSYIDSTGRNHSYKEQQKTRIKRLIENLPWVSSATGEDVGERSPVFLCEQLPEFLRPVWPYLPRQGVIAPNYLWSEEKREAHKHLRLTRPLSPLGIGVLFAMLKVSEENRISDLRVLMEECGSQIYRVIRQDNDPAKWSSLFNVLKTLGGKLGYKSKRAPQKSLPLEEVPPKLLEQMRTFESRAKNGFQTGMDIKLVANRRYGLKLDGINPQTVRDYLINMLLMLGQLPASMRGPDLELRHLLVLEARQVEIDGIQHTFLVNPLVEFYRDIECARRSDRKAVGSDSTQFCFFMNALKAMAAYNGYLHLRQEFKQAYSSVRVDPTIKEERKEKKKEVFGRTWLDAQIKELAVHYRHIVNGGLYNHVKSRKSESRRALKFCLFYVYLVTLRYMGYRQQCLRDCVVDENIIFERDGSITLQWPASKIKNKVLIRTRLSAEDFNETHPFLFETLILYRKIYSYLKQVHGSTIGDQFFGKLNVKGQFVPFEKSTDFYRFFTGIARGALKFEQRMNVHLLELNPHLLRAICAKWLDDLGFSSQERSLVIGDLPETVDREYVGKRKIYDATSLWVKKNQEIKSGKKAERAKDFQAQREDIVNSYDQRLAALERVIQAQSSTIETLNLRLNEAESEKEALKVRLEAALEEVAKHNGKAVQRNRADLITVEG